MITINLTDEQAKFLADKMEAVLDDAHWKPNMFRAEAAEHAQTILTKINRETRRNQW